METNRRDIENLEDVKLLVNTFYNRVQENKLLGPVFEKVIQNRWPQHLDTMYRFWESVLLEVRTYSGSPAMKHLQLPINGEHFSTWLLIFKQTVNDLYSGEKATEAIWRAEKMAEMFAYKVDNFQKNGLNIL